MYANIAVQAQKKINFYNESISIKVPNTWVLNDNYVKIHNYQILYEAKVFNKQNSLIKIEIYDSTLRRTAPIDSTIFTYFKDEILHSVSPTVNFLDSSISEINSKRIAILEYLYQDRFKKWRYAKQVYFKGKNNEFCRITFDGYNIHASEFKLIVNKIYSSLKICL